MKIDIKWTFLIVIILIYITLFFFSNKLFFDSFNFSLNIFSKMLPAFLLVFVFMLIFNFFITKKIIKKFFGNNLHGWFFAIVGGILSIGPIYTWYPLLQEMKDKGVSYGFCSCFMYSKAIKIPLIPIMIFYFEIEYVLILSLVIIIFAIIQGLIMNKIMNIKT